MDPTIYQAALDWINAARVPKELIDRFVSKPPPPNVRELPRSLSEKVAQAIIDFVAKQPKGRLAVVEDLKAIAGVDDLMIQDLLYSASLMVEEKPPEPEQPPPAEQAIGVLLPLRLETRFYPPEPGGEWRLRLRISPDRASLHDHDPIPTVAELDSIEAFWQSIDGDLSHSAAGKSWSLLATRVGPIRANWLARTYPPTVSTEGKITVNRPAQTRSEPQISQLHGLPERLEVWMARGGNPPALVAELGVDHGLLVVDLPTYESDEDLRWWSSFKLAQDAGLATEIMLGTTPPDDIDVLFVVGLGSDKPGDLFQQHVDSGALGVLAPASPTNTVSGAPAADLALDAELWLTLLSTDIESQPGAMQVNGALTGEPGGLGPLPGGEASARHIDQQLVRALWPALWGHTFKDILGLGAPVHQAGLWAGDNLVPEGAIPPVRLGNVPYGLLPTTSLTNWQAEPKDPPAEEAMRQDLLRMRADWAAAARGNGNVSGANTEKLLNLLSRTASSDAYSYRRFISLEMLFAMYLNSANLVDLIRMHQWWNQVAGTLLSYPVDPPRKYVALSNLQDLHIPLVEPDNLPANMTFSDLLSAIAQTWPGELANGSFVTNQLNGQLPNSLLVRLLIHAKVVAAAEVMRAEWTMTGPILEPIVGTGPVTLLQQHAEQFDPGNQETAAYQLYQRLNDAITWLATAAPDELERAFKAVLDTALYRVDPWLTGYAWRRLDTLIQQEYPLRLGVYGWVDHPAPGNPGPTNGGLLHAPSAQQALAAVVLRDRALFDAEPDRWQMDLDSQSIRHAARWGEEVRLGQHFHEVLGRAVERAIAHPNLIKLLRKSYPLRSAHDGRRTCDGKLVLEAEASELLALGLNQVQVDGLAPLRKALDVYGDLLVSEAVYHVVSGRTEIAGAAMEAASGFASPPNLAFLETPRSGRTVATTVLFALPSAPSPVPDAEASPVEVADPAVAAWLEDQTVPAAETVDDVWQWNVTTDDGSVQLVPLSAAGLRVADTAALSRGALHDLIRNAVPDGVEVERDGSGDLAHTKVRQILDLVGSRPAVPADLLVAPDAPDDAAVVADLQQRLDDLRTAADALLLRLRQAEAGDVASRAAAMTNSARWGITPVAAAHRTLEEQVRDAHGALSARLAAAPLVQDTVDMTADEIARAIAELAVPDGRLSILGRIDLAQLNPGLSEDGRATPAALNDLDEEWLSLNAMVRSPLARLEIFQLDSLVAGSEPPLFAWTNRPGDPWQANVAPDPETELLPDTELVAVYGPEGVVNGAGDVAIAVVDAWSEVVPDTAHVTTAAFGFDAPASRAPQAILLAVPPVVGNVMDGQTLVDIVAETRESAHARMAIPADLGRYAGGVPAAMLPSTGNTGVELTPWVNVVIE